MRRLLILPVRALLPAVACSGPATTAHAVQNGTLRRTESGCGDDGAVRIEPLP